MTTPSVKKEMKIKLHMNGEVNGYKFTIDGHGNGVPNEGTQTIYLTVSSGGTLPFAYDILTTAFQYGNRVFTEYEDIPDYFKQSFPDGYSWERHFEYEDGGNCHVTSVISLDKKDKGCFFYDITFTGKDFPKDGPVMQKNVSRWEPSTEIMYMSGKELKGYIAHAMLLKDGSHYQCNFNSTYKAKNPAGMQFPTFHFIDHRIQILHHSEDFKEVTLYEKASARYSPIPAMVTK